jgi:hypothetical protein
MKQLLIIALALSLMNCQKEAITPQKAAPMSVFDDLWQFINDNYAYFDYKGINWQQKKLQYARQISPEMSADSLFTVCGNLVKELRDGHCLLKNGSKSASYPFTDGYEIYFDVETVKSKYLKNSFQTKGKFTYGIIRDSVGYIYLSDFVGQNYLPTILNELTNKNIKKLIIDIRGNGGGNPDMAQTMLGHFVNQETTLGYLTHKNGAGKNDFGAKLSIKATPKTPYFGKKVNILINRKAFSASSYFSGMAQYLNNVTLIGQVTGGGGGGPMSYELPNGWTVTATANFFLDSQNNHIENGVPPDVKIANTQVDFDSQIDRMLERGIAF